MKQKIKLQMMGFKRKEDLIGLKLYKSDDFNIFLARFLNDLGFPKEEIIKLDLDFKSTVGFFNVKARKIFINMFVEEKYVFIALNFPKKQNDKIWEIVKDNFFISSERHA